VNVHVALYEQLAFYCFDSLIGYKIIVFMIKFFFILNQEFVMPFENKLSMVMDIYSEIIYQVV